jgi:uncharacterized membrane protein
MSTAWIVLLLWIGFTATHLGLASVRVEPRLRARMGDLPFLGLYSAVALAFFVPLVWFYFGHRHQGDPLWVVSVGPVLRVVLYAAMTVAVALVLAGVLRPSPASIAPGEARVEGAFRVTRHPLVLGVGLLMLLHTIPFGYPTDLAFFAGFVVFTLAGAWHQDRRKLRAGSDAFRAFHAGTRFLPFSGGTAALRGLAEIPLWIWGAAVAAALAIRWIHPLGIWP